MYSFGKSSTRHLATADYRLQEIFNEVIKHVDCTIICGFRCEAEQNAAYSSGNSQVDWPHSKHNTNPSKAVDVAPYHPEKPHIHWDDTEEFICFHKLVNMAAHQKGYKLRWGGDWDGDGVLTDQKLNDLVHFEIVDE